MTLFYTLLLAFLQICREPVCPRPTYKRTVTRTMRQQPYCATTLLLWRYHPFAIRLLKNESKSKIPSRLSVPAFGFSFRISKTIDMLTRTEICHSTGFIRLFMTATTMEPTPAVPTPAVPTPPDDYPAVAAARRKDINCILWRDVSFLFFAFLATSFTTYIELHAHDESLRGQNGIADDRGIIDGYIATSNLFTWLKNNPDYNDLLALLNTLLCVLLPFLYLAYVTLWIGDYDLSFRYLATQLLRSICGFLTFLPPNSGYLMSWNDIPHIWQKQLKEENVEISVVGTTTEPFVSFFSGHVATMIICANHLYLHGHLRLGVAFHILNALQIVRLLATRGHYSIDIIIAWYVASHVSRSAGRLGWYYSRGRTIKDWAPTSIKGLFERIVGIEGDRRSLRYLWLLEKIEVQAALLDLAEKEEMGYRHSEAPLLESTIKLIAEGNLLHLRSTGPSESLGQKEKEG